MKSTHLEKNRQTARPHLDALTREPGVQPALSQPADLSAAIADPRTATPEALQSMQQQAGNQAVLDWLKRPAAGGDLDAGFSGAVQAAHGAGLALPGRLREELEHDLGADFGAVRLHVDGQADALNQQIEARAFTVGADIFFQRGAYSPHSAEGQRTLRHELTHVVQQRGRFTPHLRLGPENDAFEQEARRFAAGPYGPPQRASGAERFAAGPDGSPQALAAGGAAPTGSVQRILGKKNRNIPAPQVPASSQDETQLDLVTGKNNINRVYKVTPPPASDAPQPETYFKPNPNSEETGTQETSGSSQAAKAVANSRMDQWLGLGAMAKENFAQRDTEQAEGEVGAESEAVEGKAIGDIHRDPANAHDFSHPETQKGLANTQLEDAITGQSDRHWNNLLINQKTGVPKAIDEDRSFGASYEANKITDLKNDLPEDQKYQDPEALKILNARGQGKGYYAGLPSHIDMDAAKAMMEHKAEDLPEVLNSGDQKQRLEEHEIKEAQARFKLVKHYVKAGVASSANPVEMLQKMGVTDPEKAGQWAEKWKGRWNERYASTRIQAPKIVSEWNQQTFQEQVHGDAEWDPQTLAPISRQFRGRLKGGRDFGPALTPSSYTQRAVMEHERFKNPFLGAMPQSMAPRVEDNRFLRQRVPVQFKTVQKKGARSTRAEENQFLNARDHSNPLQTFQERKQEIAAANQIHAEEAKLDTYHLIEKKREMLGSIKLAKTYLNTIKTAKPGEPKPRARKNLDEALRIIQKNAQILRSNNYMDEEELAPHLGEVEAIKQEYQALPAPG